MTQAPFKTFLSLVSVLLISLTAAGAPGQEVTNSGRMAQVKEEQVGNAPAGFTLIASYEDGLKGLYSSKVYPVRSALRRRTPS